MTDFDDRGGIVPCNTPWGQWWQTLEEICIEINVPEGTKAKEVNVNIKPSKLKVVVRGELVIEGEFPKVVHADEAVWTLEDKKVVRIVVSKTHRTAANCWRSLLVNQYEADPVTYDDMEQKLTLQKFQTQY